MSTKTEVHTPWGVAQDTEVLAEGITCYSTASHGGIHLSEDRVSAMPAMLRDIKTWAGGRWYEEDCDASIVILAFPWVFTPRQVASALFVARTYGFGLFSAFDFREFSFTEAGRAALDIADAVNEAA